MRSRRVALGPLESTEINNSERSAIWPTPSKREVDLGDDVEARHFNYEVDQAATIDALNADAYVSFAGERVSSGYASFRCPMRRRWPPMTPCIWSCLWVGGTCFMRTAESGITSSMPMCVTSLGDNEYAIPVSALCR